MKLNLYCAVSPHQMSGTKKKGRHFHHYFFEKAAAVRALTRAARTGVFSAVGAL